MNNYLFTRIYYNGIREVMDKLFFCHSSQTAAVTIVSNYLIRFLDRS